LRKLFVLLSFIILSVSCAKGPFGDEGSYYHSDSDKLKDLSLDHIEITGDPEFQAVSSLDILQKKISDIHGASDISDSFWGLRVESLKTGEVIYNHQGRKFFRPASNMKILTTSYTLEKLGTDFKFKTSIFFDRALGDDYYFTVQGSGDPSINNHYREHPSNQTKFLNFLSDAVVEKLAGLGISKDKINIKIQLDPWIFAAKKFNTEWTYHDFSYCYGAPISGLQIGRSCENFTITSKTSSDPVVIKTQNSLSSSVAITNNIKPQNGSLDIGYHVNPWGNEVLFRGRIPLNHKFQTKLAIPDSTLYFGDLSASAIRKKSRTELPEIEATVEFSVLEKSASTKAIELVGDYQSVRLGTLAKVLMKNSNNQYAESFLLRATPFGTIGGAISNLKRFLRNEVGIDTGGVAIADGSGASHYNYLRPHDLLSVLKFNHQNAKRFEAFKKTLPIAGVDGTLYKRMRSGSAKGKVWAKTGTVTRSSSLSGYVETADGELLVFSMLTNNGSSSSSKMRRVQDQVCEAMASFKR
jgi:serine-type D-Ala-D-Ala carboxypeptidase/endopeptidase (penicillin-binding protein 4)